MRGTIRQRNYASDEEQINHDKSQHAGKIRKTKQ